MSAEERYSPEEQERIAAFFAELARRTRKSGRISESRRKNILAEWEDFDSDVVMDALSAYLHMETTAAQNERYLKGIMRNKQKEKEAAHGKSGRNHRAAQGAALGDEGERLQRYAADGKSRAALTCDF